MIVCECRTLDGDGMVIVCESGSQDGMVIWCECVAGVEGKVILFCLVDVVV